MATTSETGEFGDTTWWVDEDGGRARIDRRTGWDHYIVTCRGVVRLVEGEDFGRAHDAALAAIRATRGEAQSEPQHAVGEWEEVEPDVWTWIDGECGATVLPLGGDGLWTWTATDGRTRFAADREHATRDEAMAAAEAAARGEQPTTTEWRQIDGWDWMREVGGLRVEVRRSSRDVWWTVTALLSRCGHRDVCVVRQESPNGDVGGAREDADYWLRARGVL